MVHSDFFTPRTLWQPVTIRQQFRQYFGVYWAPVPIFRHFLTYFPLKTALQYRGAFIWKYIAVLAELVHNKFAHCHEFLLKVPPTSNDAFVSPCFHVQDWSVDHLRAKGSDCSNCLHRASSCTKLTYGLPIKCIIVVGLRELKNPLFL